MGVSLQLVVRGWVAILAAVACQTLGHTAFGHGDPTLVTVNEYQLAILAQPATAFLVDGGEGPSATDLSFGVNQPEFGPPSGTDLYLETMGGLYYWDGQQVISTAASVWLAPPTVDGFGIPVANEIDGYRIDADSTLETGMTWGTYRGDFYWHADGLVNFSDSSLAAGVYGVPARLTAPGFEASEPFMLTFGWNFGILARQEGALALQSLLKVPGTAGDYDQDGAVTSADYLVWRNQIGSEPMVVGGGADGNGDGRVNLADYIVWRNHLGATAAEVSTYAVPEPTAAILAALLISTVMIFQAVGERRPRPGEHVMRHLALLMFVLLSAAPIARGDTITEFIATLTNTGVFTTDGETPPELGYSGIANFTLIEPMDGSSPTLAYDISLSGFDSVFGDGDPTPDLDKIHIHTARAGDGTTIDASFPTPHVLNILGLPAAPPAGTMHTRGGDDPDQVVQVELDGTIVVSGIWDDGDAYTHTPAGASSRTLTESLVALKAQQLHLMIHSQNTQAFGGAGGPVIGGQIVQVPEPGSQVLFAAMMLSGLAVYLAKRRRTQSLAT